ncbi:MAG TPA: GNAT family N-acetyltransferase [Polyangiaceae bacterium]|nr:GNAT family N-acetyltransferase [Polyangiaceae bacterium]
MRAALWPGAFADHDAETQAYFEDPGTLLVFVAQAAERVVGFLELDQRKYAAGCDSSPVPFVEGWYVEESSRGGGVGRALIETAEAWARAAGFTEIASDVEVGNDASLAAHHALGFDEIERVVCLRKAL